MPPILPHPLQPEPEALAHSARLRSEINRVIRQSGGWIDFSRFMALVLYAPGLGYYSAGSVKLGSGGDFVTAPEMTPLFGQTWARAVAATLDGLRGQHPMVLELGAGSGRLARDLLLALAALGTLPERYLILEVSADLRERQEALLATLPAALRARVDWCSAWPAALTGVVLANEVLDALPVHRVGWRQEGWVEMGVTLEGEDWAWQQHPLTDARVAALLPPTDGLPVPYDTEVCPDAAALMASLAHSLKAGRAYFIDYGFPAREYYHPQRHEGTLMCHVRHHAHGDPFAYPGLQDVTAHVDFTAVARAALDHGLVLEDYGTMARWLLDAGLLEVLGAIPVTDEARYLPAVSAVQKLLSPAEMGELFKVLVLGKGQGSPAASALLGLPQGT
jgi:SAM-dependent MidA family methyltransferase